MRDDDLQGTGVNLQLAAAPAEQPADDEPGAYDSGSSRVVLGLVGLGAAGAPRDTGADLASDQVDSS